MTDTNNGQPVVVPAGSNNPQPDSYVLAAQSYMQQNRQAWDEANRKVQSLYQTVVAIILALAKHGGIIPAQDIGSKMLKPEEITLTALAGIDGDAAHRKNNGTAPLYDSLRSFVATNMGMDLNKTATDIVLFAARLCRLGYTVADWNGVIKEVDGKMVVEVSPHFEPDMPRHTVPGIFLLEPKHMASGGTEYHPNVTLCVRRKATHNGKEVEISVESPIQKVAMLDHKAYFFVGDERKDGTREEATSRVGRESFMRNSALAIKYEDGLRIAAIAKAQQDKADAEAAAAKEKQQREVAENLAAGGGQGSEEDMQSRADSNAQGAPDGTAKEGEAQPNGVQQQEGNASDGKPEGESKPEDKPQDSNGQQQGEAKPENKPEEAKPDNSKALQEAAAKVAQANSEAAKLREENDKLRKAMTAEELPGWVRAMFTVPRMQQDEELRRSAFLVYSHLTGVFKTLGVSEEYMRNPTDPMALHEAKRQALTGKSKPATGAQHNRRTGK